MINNNELMEKAIELYAERFELTAIVTDTNGVPIHLVKGNNQLCNILLRQNGNSLTNRMREALQELRIGSEPVFYEIIPGMHTLIAPVESKANGRQFLWAGMMIGDDSRDWLRNHLEFIVSGTHDWKRILENTPVLTKRKKGLWMSWIHKLVHLSTLYDKEMDTPPMQNNLLQRASWKNGLDINELLHNFVGNRNIFDFLGFAEIHKDDEYTINHIAGEATEELLGATFSLGEGFLGRILLSNDYTKWENIEEDPRARFFHRYFLFPKTLFGFPIMKHDGSTAILFGGKLRNSYIEEKELEIGHMLAAVLERNLVTSALKQENMKQLQRLSSLGEICRMMVTAPDLKSTLYILVDIGLSILEGTFSCIILKDSESGKLKLVSRGKHPEVKTFARKVMKRYEDKTDHFNVSLKVCDDETAWEQSVIECPLYYKDSLLGVLCIGTNLTTDTQLSKEMNFLQTLSIIGGITLFLASQDQKQAEQRQIQTLFRSIEQFDVESFRKATEATRIAEEFTKKIGMNQLERSMIKYGCMLASYDHSFIEEMLSENRISTILMESNEVQAGERNWESAARESRIIALILFYIDHDNLDTVSFLPDYPDEILDKFIQYMNENTIVEEEFDAVELPVSSEMEALALSPREKEVLDLIVDGLNNREIAEKLYISEHTVKNHVTKIFQKLDVSDRAHAISKVYQMRYSSNNSY
ncbi:response regulator transcription factor [Virgibacillus siamensis]|uniref:response regulator transcription factor n=1 Tax=Virgibacillus siamensis TaxID=480071 RepID=UPI001FE3DDE4|nr:response regulator transcription factor [Virgibacillus siamensis]